MAEISLLPICVPRRRSSASSGVSAALWLALGAAPLVAAGPPPNDTGFVTVRTSAVATHVSAYAQVEPIASLTVSAAQTGVVAGLSVLPGMRVHAGQELARLNGPEIDAMLLQSRAAVHGAEAQLLTAQKALAIQKQQLLAQLATRQMVDQAEGAVSAAQTSVDSAQSRLKSQSQLMTVSAPSEAVVLALSSADGALVSAGQPILTLQPLNRLWLKAAYYGADLAAIHIGMTGKFAPSDQSASIPVKVSAVFGALATGGGESIALVPAHGSAAWLNGESGTVTLDSPQRMLVSVPTRALILDQGKWWVMVHTAKGDHPQEVVPGPAQGWDTFIEQGLAAGAQVIVENAYLIFHSGISDRYQVQD